MAAVESRARLLTLKDYLALPADNDLEREIIRGRLFVSPRPRILPQHLLGELFERLRALHTPTWWTYHSGHSGC